MTKVAFGLLLQMALKLHFPLIDSVYFAIIHNPLDYHKEEDDVFTGASVKIRVAKEGCL